ncbi:MAG: hypothetical protein ACLFWF_05700 [Alphaproteobacteria bacterium]
MNAETIDHAGLVRLVEAGAVRDAHVVGRPGGWSVVVRHDSEEHALAAQRSKRVRVFRRMETLVNYLRDIGIQRFDVDAAGYEAQGGEPRRRPDRAEALRQAHEAAAYDQWFRAEVEQALREADDPNTEWVPHEVVVEEMKRERAELLARIKAESESGGESE